MKRILFILTSMYGHVNPNLELIRRLTESGCEVACICSKKYSEKLKTLGARVLLNESPKEAVSDILPDIEDGYCRDAQYYATFNIETAEWQSIARERVITYNVGIIERLTDYRPDIVFYDSVAIQGLVYAKKNRIPCICVDSATNLSSTDPFFYPFYKDVVLCEIDREVREGYVPEAARDLIMPVDSYINMDRRFEKKFVRSVSRLAECDPDDLKPERTYVYLSEEMYNALGGEVSNRYFCGFGINDMVIPETKSGVYVSRGTSLTESSMEMLRHMYEGAACECDEVTVSLGGYQGTEINGNDEKVRILRFSRQVEELKRAKVFLCHGGLTGVREAIMCETPMVVYPGNFHEYQTGCMIEKLGIGVMIQDRKLTFGENSELREKIRRVMNDDYRFYTDNIKRIKDNVGKTYNEWSKQSLDRILI